MKPSVKRAMSEMLTDLYEQGRLDILRDIRDNRLTLMAVYDAYRRHSLNELATGAAGKNLVAAMRAWIDKLEAGVDYSQQHITSFETSLKYIAGAAPDAKVADLPHVLETLRDTLGKKHARSFNLLRAFASAFVRKTLKKSHPIWLAVAAVEPRKVPKRAPRPDISVEWMRNMFPSPETDSLDACAWGMALSGMGPKEYWGEWYEMNDRVRIIGTKRDARRRDVPRVMLRGYGLAPLRLSREAFRQRLEHRTKKKVSPYDFRRTFARWMERAGVMRSRRKYYMGHSSGDVTSLYEASEVDAFLASDASLMRKYLGIPEPTPTTLKVAK